MDKWIIIGGVAVFVYLVMTPKKKTLFDDIPQNWLTLPGYLDAQQGTFGLDLNTGVLGYDSGLDFSGIAR